MKIFYAAVLFLLFFSANSLAQIQGSLRGKVVDSLSSEPLAYCNVFIEQLNTGASTDERGYFYIPSIRAGNTYKVLISYIGYTSKRIEVKILGNRITDVNIKLHPSVIQLPEAEKIGERFNLQNEPDVSMQRLTIRELELLPKGIETDLFRSIQNLPGVKSTGDVSARYYVRGGASNQNLVLFDDVTLYTPFHALGLFSAIDPDVINYIEFYKGGFPTQFNGRLSSILKVTTKDGNKNRFGGSASGSFLTAKAFVEGPIPDGSFFVSGRKSHTNKILKKFFDDKNVPAEFYDFSFKANYSNPVFMENAKFTVEGFYSHDNLDNPDPLKEDFNWSNNFFSARYFQWITDSPVFYDIQVSQSSYSAEVKPNLSKTRAKKNTLYDFTLNTSVTFVLDNKNEVSGGLKVIKIDNNLKLENTRGAITDINASGANISFFLKYKLLSNKNFSADFGSRFNFTRLASGSAGQFSFEPRANLFFKIFPWAALTASWGIYQQELTTLTDENEIVSVFEPWIITPAYLDPATAFHYITGIKINPVGNFSLDVEGYYKYIKNLPALNEQKYFPEDPDLISGTGESYGLEALAKYSTGIFNLSAGYSLSWAFKKINGYKYHPRYDSRHSVNLSLAVSLGYGFEASAMWNYNSGLPFTQITGYINKLYFDDFSARSYYFQPYTLLASKNLGRLPDYHRLDFGISKQFTISYIKFFVDVSVLNVYNRNNLFYFDRKTGNRVDMLPLLPTATIKVEI